MNANWPRFELVKLDVVSAVPPSVAKRLADPGVPRGAFGYQPMNPAHPLSGDETGELICFGSDGLFGRICVRASSGEVVTVPNPERISTYLANSDLDRFAECMRAAIDRLPYYDGDSELDDWEWAAKDLEGMLFAIDPATQSYPGFWENFVADVTTGIYNTEEILGESE